MNSLHSDSSTHTSLAQLFNQPIRGMQVQAIEIPLIQRDYAQGRKNPQVQQIRERFIASLFDALDSEDGIDLDFVFGDVVDLAPAGRRAAGGAGDRVVGPGRRRGWPDDQPPRRRRMDRDGGVPDPGDGRRSAGDRGAQARAAPLPIIA